MKHLLLAGFAVAIAIVFTVVFPPVIHSNSGVISYFVLMPGFVLIGNRGGTASETLIAIATCAVYFLVFELLLWCFRRIRSEA
jgi:hypothetical protein